MTNQEKSTVNVERAVFELKAGGVVAVRSGNKSIYICSVEACSGRAQVEFRELLISSVRAQIVTGKKFPDETAIGFFADDEIRKNLNDIAGLSLKVMQKGMAKKLAGKAKKKPAIFAAALKLAKIAELMPALFIVNSPARGVFTVNAKDITQYEDSVALGLKPVLTSPLTLEKTRKATITVFKAPGSNREHYAIVVGNPKKSGKPPLVRVHSTCFTGDVLASLKCDCREQLQEALGRMNDEGAGILLYLMQEGRGIGLTNKLRTYYLQAGRFDTVDANRFLGFGDDERQFASAATMLKELGFNKVRVLTNNPRKAEGLEKQGVKVTGTVNLVIEEHEHNRAYFKTKFSKLGHTRGY